MGYYTIFQCQTETTGEQRDKLGEISGYSIESMFDGEENVKWYDFESDIKQWSEIYPDQLFEWWGEGEESGDMWRAYVKNGKYFYQKAKIMFEDFDEKSLK